ncbi:MAG: ATP-binding protein [Chromatiales bacterium]|nr:ATP-binding protein [Chromatiales bacterium]
MSEIPLIDETGIFEARLAPNFDSVKGAFELVARFRTAHGLSQRDALILNLILEELLVNTVEHGRPPDHHPVSIRLARSGYCVAIDYRDRGVAFNPIKDTPPDDIDQPVDERRVGGLGWPLIRHYCHNIRYERNTDGENALMLERRVEAFDDFKSG